MPYRSGIEQHLPLRVEGHIQAPELVLVQEADGAFVLESIDVSVSYERNQSEQYIAYRGQDSQQQG